MSEMSGPNFDPRSADGVAAIDQALIEPVKNLISALVNVGLSPEEAGDRITDLVGRMVTAALTTEP